MEKYYTGVGSRENVPLEILQSIEILALWLGCKDYTLRSGGAEGCDTAFANNYESKQDIYLPWEGFNDLYERSGRQRLIDVKRFINYSEAVEILYIIRPDLRTGTASHKALHTRNVYQVMGDDLNSISEFLICWTPGGKDIGGTATAIRLARHLNIPVFNLGLMELNEVVRGIKDLIGDEKS